MPLLAGATPIEQRELNYQTMREVRQLKDKILQRKSLREQQKKREKEGQQNIEKKLATPLIEIDQSFTNQINRSIIEKVPSSNTLSYTLNTQIDANENNGLGNMAAKHQYSSCEDHGNKEISSKSNNEEILCELNGMQKI